MGKPGLGKTLLGRAKLYEKHRARPNFVAQLIDSDGEFTIPAAAQPFCAIIAVQGSPGCASHTAQVSRRGRASKISAEAPPAQSMRNLWLIFAQTATVAVSVLFVVTTLKPEWLGPSGSGLPVVELRQGTSSRGLPPAAASFSDAGRKACPPG